MNTKYISILIGAIATLAAFVSTGCAGDEPDVEAAYEDPTFNISIKSRAGESDNELIQSWWVLFASDGRICAIAERAANGTSFESEKFSLTLNPGTYTVYAFANITRSQFETRYSYNLAQGAALPAGFGNEKFTLESHYDPGTIIPMSGSRSVSVTGRTGEIISIEVVRMLGKLEFEFRNDSQSDITFTGVSFGPLYKGAIPLYPAGVPGKPSLLSGITECTADYTFDQACTIPAASGVADRRHFYVRETTADSHPTGKYHFSVRLKRDGQADEELYALTTDLEYINRNDYIQIPVTIIDWSLKLDVQFYPPIGGYPAMLVEERNNEYFIKFGSSGKFAMTPLVRRNPQSEYLAPDRLEVAILSTDDPAGVLNGDLTIENGQIMGNLSDKPGISGSATVRISVNVKENASANRTFVRNFYIIR